MSVVVVNNIFIFKRVRRIRIDPLDVDALRDELKTLVGWRRGDGSGTYCAVKTFGIGQARTHA